MYSLVPIGGDNDNNEDDDDDDDDDDNDDFHFLLCVLRNCSWTVSLLNITHDMS
jgi:hypothetical protein